MLYKEIQPPPILSDIVRYFWIIESDEVPVTPLKYRLFAESSPGLVFFYHFNYGLISGLTDSHREFMMDGKLGMMGAFLYPYAIPLLFNIPSEKITNTTVEISDFLGNEGLMLREEVMNASTNTQRMEIISKFLLKKVKNIFKQDKGLAEGVRQIVRYKGGVSIDSLVDNMGISGRHFDRKFLSVVGIAPKVFSRLIRFQSTLQLPQTMPVKNLTDLALSAGYYDQSHFIRDFKEFSGLSPKQYFKLEGHKTADNFVTMEG